MGAESVLEVQGLQVADAAQSKHSVVHVVGCQGRDGLAFGPAVGCLAIMERDGLLPHVLVAELLVGPDVYERNEFVRIVRVLLDVAVRIARSVRVAIGGLATHFAERLGHRE
eukprot:4159304-Pleurochrysis_carterae.AAC.1